MKTTKLVLCSAVLGLALVAPTEALASSNASRTHGQTAESQGSGDREVAITRAIRKRLMAASSLSVNARNVKVITVGKQVTLKGPVSSADERRRVLNLAKTGAGQTVSVVDELYLAE